MYVIRQFDATASERRSEVRLFYGHQAQQAKGFHLILEICSILLTKD